ncbi:group II intron maturase-specific domain-containing protein [Desulfobulbus rhabdoformis]|uniref:group II intron maturase-specific domain-containing protein n=1 Tax=Desulfobulbus rhabdoformis TaxID=34032 RepID=UPI0030841500
MVSAQKERSLSVKEVAQEINPVVRGWIEFYGAFFQPELLFLVHHHLDKPLYRWGIGKYKKQGSNFKNADNWMKRLKSESPNYFVHWSLLCA